MCDYCARIVLAQLKSHDDDYDATRPSDAWSGGSGGMGGWGFHGFGGGKGSGTGGGMGRGMGGCGIAA